MHIDSAPPLLIVGAGPVGATMALLMAKRGHEVVLVDRKSGPCEHPAAHFIHSRTLEILAEIDPSLVQAANARGAPIDEIEEILWCTALEGMPLARCSALPDTPEQRERYHVHSPHRSLHLPQHRFEPILYEWIAREPRIELLLGTEWIGAEEESDRVISTLRRSDGSAFTRESSFVIGADGAASDVRKSLGIKMEGPPLETLISVFFQAPLEKRSKGILYWIINPSLIGVLVHHFDDDWVLMIPYHPEVEKPGDFREGDFRRLIRAAFGRPDLEPKIKVARSWFMSTAIADQYRAGRIFLIGDAAHRFPPTGGFGANTGIQDAHNLAWKLDTYLRGRAGEALLATYEQERRPIAVMNAKQSERNYEMTHEMSRALGLDPRAVDRLLGSALFNLLPRGLQRRILRGGQALALRALSKLSQASAAGETLRGRLVDAIEHQRDHFLTRGQELGFHYEDGALIPLEAPKPVIGEGIREYLPVLYPGARFPHFWVENGGKTISSHALLDRASLTLIAHESKRALLEPLLAEAAAGLPLRAAYWGKGEGAFYPSPREISLEFQLEEGQIVIVRPDAHTAAVLPVGEAPLRRVLEELQRFYLERNPEVV